MLAHDLCLTVEVFDAIGQISKDKVVALFGRNAAWREIKMQTLFAFGQPQLFV